jgi:hypothetical protein
MALIPTRRGKISVLQTQASGGVITVSGPALKPLQIQTAEYELQE